jgi:hypothetical protein
MNLKKKLLRWLAIIVFVASIPWCAHGQVLRSGTLVTWGGNDNSAAPLYAEPDVIDVACGSGYLAALRASRRVVVSSNAPYLAPPVSAQSGVARIAGGRAHLLALKDDGSLLAWGANVYGQASPPAQAQSGVIAIAAGDFHSLALKADGSVLAWGANGWGQTNVPPAAREGVIAIAVGYAHSLALKANGSVVAWGDNSYGQRDVPDEALRGVAAVAAGADDSVAIKSDGTLVIWGWGAEKWGLPSPPSIPVKAQSGVKAVAVGNKFIIALKNDGSVVGWGENAELAVPAGLTDAIAVAAGLDHGAAIIIPAAPSVLTPPVSQTVHIGSPVQFTVEASGYPKRFFQWRKDGVDIEGATNAVYRIDSGRLSDHGDYNVVVANTLGATTSAPPTHLSFAQEITIHAPTTDFFRSTRRRHWSRVPRVGCPLRFR